MRRRIPTLANKFRQLRETGVTMLVGTDSGIPGNFHTDSTWRELATWVELGMTPMQAIAGATRWPAVFLKKEKDIGTLAPGRYADIVAVRGDVLTNIELLQRAGRRHQERRPSEVIRPESCSLSDEPRGQQ